MWGINKSTLIPDIPVHPADIYRSGTDIYFNCTINSASINRLQKKVIKIIKNYSYLTNETHSMVENKTPPKMTIRIIIDSCGGEVYGALKFIDFISIIRSQYPNFHYISCIIGTAFSAATLMAIVADHRQMTTNALAMVHQMLLWDEGGSISEMNTRMKCFNDLGNKIADIYVQKSKKAREFIDSLLTRESWFDSSKYLELGFIDQII